MSKEIKINHIINKIFNELKYNKKLIISWRSMFSSQSTEDIRTLLKQELQTLITDILYKDIEISKVDSIQMFKSIKNKTVTPSNSEVNSENEHNRKLNIVTFSSEKELISESIQINYFIDLDLKNFLLSVLWLETVGYWLDSNLSDDIYANRLSNNKTSFFKPYYSAYSDFRDSNFKVMREWIDKNQTGVYVQIDFERCFYNVNLEKLQTDVNRFLEQLDVSLILDGIEFDKERLKVLNTAVFEIIRTYNNKLKENDCKLNGETIKTGKVLPIGFLPSNILINFYLKDVDEQIKDEYHPVNYARYVDDIAFVIRSDLQERNVQQKISKIEGKLKNIFPDKSNEKETNEKETKALVLNTEKTLYFVIGKKNDINYLNKFQKQTERLSSDSQRLIDPSEIEEEFDQAYILTKDLTKLSDMFTIVKDKKYISRVIASIYRYVFSELRSSIDPLYVKLSKQFIEYFYSFVDDEYFISLIDYWYHLITIEFISKKINVDEEIEKEILESLTTWQKILELEEKYSSGDDDFINVYQKLLKELYLTNGSQCDVVQKIFRLPKYKLDNNIYSDEYLRHYELQLREINNFITLPSDSTREIEVNSNNISSLVDVFVKKIRYQESKKILDDYEFKDSVRIAQANFYSYDERGDFFKKYARNFSNVSDIITTLNEANKLNADILTYPEQGIVFEDLALLTQFAARTKMLIIGGFDFIYHEGIIYNFTVAIIPRKLTKDNIEYRDCEIRLIPKVFPAPEEYDIFHHSKHPEDNKNWEMYIPNEDIIAEVNKNRIFEFRHCKQALLNCYEATSIDLKYSVFKEEPLVTHLITNNKDIKYYYQIAESFSRELMAATTITNYSKLGGVQVYSPYKEEYARKISHHKGSKNTHVDICDLSIKDLKDKRLSNKFEKMKQNPPIYYYRNVGR